MATDLTAFKKRLDYVLLGVGTTEIDAATREAAVREAVAEYSRDRPRVLVGDVSGDGSQYYELGAGESLTSWQNEFSTVQRIDYPAADVTADEEPEWLEPEDWALYQVGDTRYLYFPNHSPSTGETARVWYTVRYEFTAANEVETPTADFEAVCTLAGAVACEWLAVRYGQHSDSTISADVVNYRTKSDMYASRVKELRRRYAELLGRGEDLEAAAAVGDIDFGWAVGRDFLFHGRRGR